MTLQALPGENATIIEEPIKFTVEEQVRCFNIDFYRLNIEKLQVMAYSSLYAMALLCVVWGSFRSLSLTKRTVDKKRTIEASIGDREAAKFPFMASAVLFGLYVVFKCV